MIFLATLIALLIERFFHWNHLRRWQWFARYESWIATKMGNRHPALLLAIDVLPIALVIGIISCSLSGWMYGIGHLIFGTIVLLYCLGPNNLWDQTYQCLGQLNSGNPQQAIDQAQAGFGIASTPNSQTFHRTLLQAIFVAANKRIFAVIFWFAILGPMGAFLYRSIELSTTSSAVSQLAQKIRNMLDWLPARLLTFFFALTGHFSKVFGRWISVLKKGLTGNDTVLAECGMAALDSANAPSLPEDGSAEKEALMLFDRTLILMLVILAVVTLVRL
jgi:AmpE protein